MKSTIDVPNLNRNSWFKNFATTHFFLFFFFFLLGLWRWPIFEYKTYLNLSPIHSNSAKIRISYRPSNGEREINAFCFTLILKAKFGEVKDKCITIQQQPCVIYRDLRNVGMPTVILNTRLSFYLHIIGDVNVSISFWIFFFFSFNKDRSKAWWTL